MSAFTLHDLQCFDAVVRSGGFQAAADLLHRSHPAVFAAVSKLERQLGLELLDRSGYRVRLTDRGRSVHARAQSLLRQAVDLDSYAAQLATGEESELSVVVGDVCPRPQLLALLARFFADRPRTKLHLHYEAVGGPWERLIEADADLILHRVEKTDTRIEWIDLCRVTFVPVVARDFLPFAVTDSIKPEQLRRFTLCVIRDTARNLPSASYFLIEGAHQCTVADQLMKKEVIANGMSWGHLPHFLITEELRDGRLLSLAGKHFPGRAEEVVAARLRDRPHGPVANALWSFLGEHAPTVGRSIDGRPAVVARRYRSQTPQVSGGSGSSTHSGLPEAITSIASDQRLVTHSPRRTTALHSTAIWSRIAHTAVVPRPCFKRRQRSQRRIEIPHHSLKVTTVCASQPSRLACRVRCGSSSATWKWCASASRPPPPSSRCVELLHAAFGLP